MSTELSQMYYDPTASGRDRYAVEMRHHGLNKYNVVRGYDQAVLANKVEAQARQWDEQWLKKRKWQDRKLTIEQGKQSAVEQTNKALQVLSSYESVLKIGLSGDPNIDWDGMLNRTSFNKPKPKEPARPPKPTKKRKPTRPKETDKEYKVELGLLDKIIASRRRKKDSTARKAFNDSLKRWEKQCQQIETAHKGTVTKWKNKVAALEAEYNAAVEAWNKQKENFEEAQKDKNSKILARKEFFEKKEPSAVLDYFVEVVASSRYPHLPNPSVEIDIDHDQGILVCDYQLPPKNAVQTLEKVTFVQSRQEFNEKHLAERKSEKLYEGLLYQICLRTIHELFASDVHAIVKAVVFNGWVRFIDKATGQNQNSCIMSIQVMRREYDGVNLSLVDAKECFKSWKGVSASKLADIAPVAPLLIRPKEDSRFVQSYAVAHSIEEGENLASMDWEDFEHLVRELFEDRFARDGGEVRVTQASRDGGVDAIAFDPDPIRGGKIVIQAKRYTNTVEVAAVRDLYGTVVDEGAIKGILITTSDFGPDAHKWASNKPITLLNGGMLLSMLAEHGKKARINLKEAKVELRGRTR